jgi:hypothetical protein
MTHRKAINSYICVVLTLSKGAELEHIVDELGCSPLCM